MELSQQEVEHDAREAALLAELAHTRRKLAEKKKSPTKMLKKTLTQVWAAFWGWAGETWAAGVLLWGCPPPLRWAGGWERCGWSAGPRQGTPGWVCFVNA
jgi:hypothetical protein